LDKKQVEVNAIKEMEEAEEAPTRVDQLRL
jgi:hypothetical protein